MSNKFKEEMKKIFKDMSMISNLFTRTTETWRHIMHQKK